MDFSHLLAIGSSVGNTGGGHKAWSVIPLLIFSLFLWRKRQLPGKQGTMCWLGLVTCCTRNRMYRIVHPLLFPRAVIKASQIRCEARLDADSFTTGAVSQHLSKDPDVARHEGSPVPP